MITLARGNVVKIVDSQDKADKLIKDGFEVREADTEEILDKGSKSDSDDETDSNTENQEEDGSDEDEQKKGKGGKNGGTKKNS